MKYIFWYLNIALNLWDIFWQMYFEIEVSLKTTWPDSNEEHLTNCVDPYLRVSSDLSEATQVGLLYSSQASSISKG